MYYKYECICVNTLLYVKAFSLNLFIGDENPQEYFVIQSVDVVIGCLATRRLYRQN